MSAGLLKKYGILSYEEAIESGEFCPVRTEDLRNESLAYQLGKWLRSLHTAVPDPGDREVSSLPVIQETWGKEKAIRLSNGFLSACPAAENEIAGQRIIQVMERAGSFADAFRNLPRVFSFRDFDAEHILINRDRTQVVVRVDLMIGYRYRDVRRICSHLQFWGQWAFLWGYAMPIPEGDKYPDRLSEILEEIGKQNTVQDPDFGRILRLLQDPLTEKALHALEEDRDDNSQI